MATPQENAAAIVAHAATLDSLIEQFRGVHAALDAREHELRMFNVKRGDLAARSGQERLAIYAHSLMMRPHNGGDPSASALASSAWAEFL